MDDLFPILLRAMSFRADAGPMVARPGHYQLIVGKPYLTRKIVSHSSAISEVSNTQDLWMHDSL
jgi:hypothetical protein